MQMLANLVALLPLVVQGASPAPAASTCGDMKQVYRDSGCCGMPTKVTDFQVVPMPNTHMFKNNPCAGNKPEHANATLADGYFKNVNCTDEKALHQALEQSGTNVTKGYQGLMSAKDANRYPINTAYWKAGLCPVNVHWHVGTEHLSVGQYDEKGSGPPHRQHATLDDDFSRRLAAAAPIRTGFRCHHYNAADPKFTKNYSWQHCVDMDVGETYEVHWPHSAAGACSTPWQYQTPFYDGVFCVGGIISLDPLNTFEKIGVQAQIFTIVNDEAYYYPDLMRGMIVNGNYGADMSYYTGSTTGTSRSNEVCSRFTPITWQVDRTCHLISASSFDKMCAEMKAQTDDMSGDLHPHGSRELVLSKFAADNHQRL